MSKKQLISLLIFKIVQRSSSVGLVGCVILQVRKILETITLLRITSWNKKSTRLHKRPDAGILKLKVTHRWLSLAASNMRNSNRNTAVKQHPILTFTCGTCPPNNCINALGCHNFRENQNVTSCFLLNTAHVKQPTVQNGIFLWQKCHLSLAAKGQFWVTFLPRIEEECLLLYTGRIPREI